MKIITAIVSACLLMACEKAEVNQMNTTVTPVNIGTTHSYLALGDSYTIGEAVEQNLTFPFQLAAKLGASGIVVSAPKVIAKTGWTTGELQSAINAANLKGTYDIVTLLIGVNNQYRGMSSESYRTEFKSLLQQAIAFAGGKKEHVFVVSIPDWGLTPYGASTGRDQSGISAEIDTFNSINKTETLAMGVNYTDITPGSRAVINDPALVASDGLHPSGKMYGNWSDAMLPAVKAAFQQN
ncbi:SGNH/GDSL hydrolase family protein [Pedobacter duraquae]|uniref:Lysophospholipase L1-like esterase n=1 Tax=Pedobacter duraquae TaxID=425511 RepID=A0A4R6IH71_9SPHI|nr:SGNH/GDSL hydrolase family protein [Pedobacter duraquae]TDO21514.1 lysophospholipase L1-like esterase [Pedobacter duraquae]